MLALINNQFCDIYENYITPQAAFQNKNLLYLSCIFKKKKIKLWRFDNEDKTIEPIFCVQYGPSSWDKENIFSLCFASESLTRLVTHGYVSINPSKNFIAIAQYMSIQFESSGLVEMESISQDWTRIWLFDNKPIANLLNTLFDFKWQITSSCIKKSNAEWQRSATEGFGINIILALDKVDINIGAGYLAGNSGTMFIFHNALCYRFDRGAQNIITWFLRPIL